MSSFGSKDNQLHIANNTSETIYIFVSPNMEYVLGDLIVDVVLAVAVSLIAPQVSALKIVQAIKKMTDIVKILKLISLFSKIKKVADYAGKAAQASTRNNLAEELRNKDVISIDDLLKIDLLNFNLDSLFEEVKKFLTKIAVISIEPGTYRKVNENVLYNPLSYFSASGWGAVCGGSELSVAIVNESFTKTTSFDTNSDWSWVVNDKAVVRSVYGKIWQEDSRAGAYSYGANTIEGVGTSNRASASVYQDQLYLAWKGVQKSIDDDDKRIWYASTKNGLSWTAQQAIPNAGSSTGAALKAFNNRLYAVWKGQERYAMTPNGAIPIEIDTRIWYSSFDGQSWIPQQVIPNVATSTSPALAVFDNSNRLYALWKGVDNDTRIWYSSFDGQSWTAQQVIPNVGTSTSPALAMFKNRLYALWKGVDNDSHIFYASFDGQSWTAQQVIPDVGTSVGVSLTVFNEKLYATWKGVDNDTQIWYSSFDGQSWRAQQMISYAYTDKQTTLAEFNNMLYQIWSPYKGNQNSSSIAYETLENI
jgi:hypothetical protein